MQNNYRTIITIALLFIIGGCAATSAQTSRPNVIMIMTDDQGYGDLGFHGNPIIKTPNIDNIARQSAQMQYFHVSPVCTPTRACLMTGRYNQRTKAIDTYMGRAMMHPDEVTIAEMLSSAGYRTGIFGKWHLGDHYPMRPHDQGFTESLVHHGGGIRQPSDPPQGNSYFDPLLEHNGKLTKTKGYCSNVYTDAAIKFITKNRNRPFFVYLPYNCPHTPLEVADKDYMPYMNMDLSIEKFPAIGNGIMHPQRYSKEETAKIYGMVTNIDDNLGRLFAKLDKLKLTDNTMVIFLTDNGPQQPRYNSGLNMRKGSVYDGGIRVPCFIRWPGKIEPGKKIDRIAAHIDLAPTLLEACSVAPPANVKLDGKSLMPLLTKQNADWPDRTLYFQWHRGDKPELNRACAVRRQRYKLVQPNGIPDKKPWKPKFQLYDMLADPYEMNDIAAQHPQILARMKADHESWFRDVCSTRGFEPCQIHIGTPHENPVVLTRQDWRGPRASWRTEGLGYWVVLVAREGKYDITLRFRPMAEPTSAHFFLGKVKLEQKSEAHANKSTFKAVSLPPGPNRLMAWTAKGEQELGVNYVEVKRID
ncbi:MAG: arylsulfatase [Planctomycetota bacterium]|jgi:arylsulfatase A-like enzyme